jgi:hypothetical protein
VISPALAQAKPEDTELWKPVPAVVTPAKEAGGAPSDAIVLFDGGDLKPMGRDRGQVAGRLDRRGRRADRRQGARQYRDPAELRDYQLHLEWRIPADITGSGQARGNSGVFLASTGPGDHGYELQISTLSEPDLRQRPGRQRLQAASAAGERRPQAGRVADL